MKNVIKRLNKFRDERNWKQFHTGENLSKSIMIEAAELLENFQWGEEPVDKQNIKEEIADVLNYALMFCDLYGFDVEEILNEKIDQNEKKYPVDKAFGKADKYNKL